MLKNVVINLEDRVVFNHHSNLPNSFRMLIVGSSGCGKTVLLLRMLVEPGFIDYDNLIIYTTTKIQQEYQLLYHGFSNGLSKESIAAILIHQKEFKDTAISVLCKNMQNYINLVVALECRWLTK
jgi:ABC-type bacteriocin/lantibiotic exporter with double-glycine peptidase domain